MNFRGIQQRDFANNNSLSGSEPDENSKDETHTIDNDLNLGKNASIPEVQQPKFKKPIVTSSSQRKKSILKPSRTFDRSSSDEQIVKNNYFLEKGNAHHQHEPPSEISEIEKAASFINNKTAEEYIVKEENSQAENTPQNNRLPTKIPNFGVLSKFSPNREHQNNPLLDISSPISQNFDDHDRNGTEESQKEPVIVGKIEKIEGRLLPPSLPLEAHQVTEITKDRSNSNRLFTETPLFKTEKAKRTTTESNSQNPGSGSITIIQNEEQVNPPSVNKEDGKSKISNSEVMESYQRRLNDSSVSKRKKATFFANEAKNGNIIPGYTRYVLDENINQQQVYMPHFSDREIFESFKTLDINKAGYVTAVEIKHFLEVLEEEVNEAEIEEMVRMLDYEGTQRVRYEEFYKMATGKNLNPIGQAYPPTLDLFEKKKNAEIIYDKKRAEQTTMAFEHSGRNQSSRGPQPLNKESARYSGIGPSSRAEMDSIYPKHTAKIDNKLSKLPRLGDLGDEGVKPIKTDKDETDTYFKGFIRQAGLSVKTFMEKYDIVQFSNHHKVAKATYKDFLGFFVIDDQDVTKKIFSLVGRDRNYIDLRQMMIAISMYLEFNADEKISLAYDLYDPENHGYILYMELMKVFNMFQIGEENKKLERKIKTILNRRSVMPEDSISKEEFVIICKNFPDLFN